MPSADLSGKSGPYLLAASAILSAAILIAAFRISVSFEVPPPSEPPTIIRARPAPSSPAGSAPTIAAVGSDYVLLADDEGLLFQLAITRAGPYGKLVLQNVYQLRRDTGRFADAPSHKSPSGWYLDDLAEEKEERAKAVREEFDRLAGAGGTSTDAVETILALARDLVDQGEVSFLTDHLDDASYIARRSAAIALGERGWRRAMPVLIEIARQGDEGSRDLIRPIFEGITGLEAPRDRTNPEAWKEAIERWQQWWSDHR